MKDKDHFTQRPFFLTLALLSAIVGLFAFLSGHETLPDAIRGLAQNNRIEESATAQKFKPEPLISSAIRVERESRWSGKARRMRIYVDGRSVGSLWSGGKKEVAMAPGRHAVYAEMVGRRSEIVEVDVRPGELVIVYAIARIDGLDVVAGPVFPPRS